MYDFTPRIDSVAADRAAPVRVVPAVTAAAASGEAAGSASDAGVGADGGEEARREHMASAADYARIQARIAQILANMSAGGGGGSASAPATADAEIEAMLPRSTIVIPLPPATTESIERALKLAREMASQADLARAAQANVASGTVSQMMAGAS